MLSINNVCIPVLHITREPNLMILLLFTENISKFWTSLLPHRLSSKHLLVSQHSFRLWIDVFSLQLLKKQMKSIKQCFLSILALNVAFCFCQQFGYFVFEQLWTLLPFSHCCRETIRLWLYTGSMQPYLMCVCPQQNILNEHILPIPKPYMIFRVPL